MAYAMPANTTTDGRPFTRGDLDHMPDDGRRYEVVDGMLHVSAAPSRLHQRAVGRLYRVLDDACPADLEVMIAPFAVALTEDTQMQPDVLVGRRSEFTERELAAPPVLVVEVLSPSSRLYDTQIKRERFERAGTPAFWVVDPVMSRWDARLVAWAIGEAGRYRQVADVKGEDSYVAELPFPVAVTPAELVR